MPSARRSVSARLLLAALVTLGNVRSCPAAPPPDAPASPCRWGRTDEIESCRQTEQQGLDVALARYERTAMKRMKEGRPGDHAVLTRFEAFRQAWLRYRDAECDAVYEQWSDGSIRGIEAQVCRRRLTQDRMHEIWADWLTYMDSTPSILPKPPIGGGP
ncbi:lysozyme inhibitor LprI family protein [Rhizosaccharibacter radicis]|uniref:DUF1311 domain-containing protein n=1 Tax=Rhizosaccharibacter radicis TaxID=2782605 RepID=A0ABT1VVG3_9PROT|nr:DUF1311 domain-containing protein [Acetobacteraceae bacterium KSS12]